MDTSANQDLIRSINQRMLLDILRNSSADSIKELSELSKLSVPSTNKNVDDLIQKGLVARIGTTDTKMGRKPARYTLNTQHKYIIAVDLGERIVNIALGMLDGRLGKIMQLYLKPNENGEAFVERLCSKIEGLVEETHLSFDAIAAIVIANPGVVNSKTGSLLFSADTAVWADVAIKDVLFRRFGIFAIVLNDVNVSAMGEMKCGAGIGLSHCMFIRLDVGVGAGIILNGNLYEGLDGAAGEIGFSILSPERNEDKSERYVDKILTINSLLKRIRDRVAMVPDSSVLSAAGGDANAISLEWVASHFETDPIVHEELVQFTRSLAVLISNVMAVLNLPVVIIGGEAVLLGERFLGALQQTVSELSVFPPKLMFATCGSKSALFGAVAIGVQHYFDNLEL